MNDNDIPDHLLSQVLDTYKKQGRRPIGFIIGFDDGPTDQVLLQALDEYESRGKASNASNFDFGIDTLLPEIPTVPRFGSPATVSDLKDLVSEMESENMYSLVHSQHNSLFVNSNLISCQLCSHA